MKEPLVSQLRQTFKTNDELIEFLLNNHYPLSKPDLSHIFLNCNISKKEKYKNRLSDSIKFLLNTLNSDESNALIELLNSSDFSYIQYDGKFFSSPNNYYYDFNCNNLETAGFLIELANMEKTNSRKSISPDNLNTFKEALNR